MNDLEPLVSMSLKIKNTRKAVGLSQKKLSKLAGMSQSTVARLESDIVRLNPSYETVFRIMESLYDFQVSEKNAGMINKPIKSIMQSRFIHVSPRDSVEKAVTLMKENDFTQLPVLNNSNSVVGTINEKRLLKLATESPVHPSRMKVSEILDPALPGFDEKTEILRIRSILENFGAVLVLREGKAVGIITIYDILKFL